MSEAKERGLPRPGLKGKVRPYSEEKEPSAFSVVDEPIIYTYIVVFFYSKDQFMDPYRSATVRK